MFYDGLRVAVGGEVLEFGIVTPAPGMGSRGFSGALNSQNPKPLVS